MNARGFALQKLAFAPLGQTLSSPGCSRIRFAFKRKLPWLKKVEDLQLPISCRLYLVATSWYWARELVKVCRQCGCHMISQLESGSVIEVKRKLTKVTEMDSPSQTYREVSLLLYGKTNTSKIAKFIGFIKDSGQVVVVAVKEKGKKLRHLISTNIQLPVPDVVKYYPKSLDDRTDDQRPNAEVSIWRL
jgi:hypothetical protein